MFAADLPTLTPVALDSAILTQRLQAALRSTMFGSRLTVTPRRLGQLAGECTGSFQRYVAMQDDDEPVRAFGQRLSLEGLGHSSLLALIEVLQGLAWELGPQPAGGRAPARYILPLLAGYMAAREAYLLAEQERTRTALERAQARPEQ